MKYIQEDKIHEYRKAFLELKSGKQLAELIGTTYEHLKFIAFDFPESKKYYTFTIPKKSGGYRTINSPDQQLKIVQERLNEFLQIIYTPTQSAHGFIPERSIVTNALPHINKKYVFNIDLKDFFPSVNFGRVRGLLMSKPYNLQLSVATTIAQICCHENSLPQGAPTSPIITNMICSRLDTQLSRHAEKYNCNYTRYADDITFSKDTAFTKGFKIRLRKIIGFEGFEINESKLRIQSKIQHQEVTGLVVNKKVNVKRRYIRKVRAILHSWETKGIRFATKLYAEKYNRHRVYGLPNFINSIGGMIQFIKMVRGEEDIIFLKLKTKFDILKKNRF